MTTVLYDAQRVDPEHRAQVLTRLTPNREVAFRGASWPPDAPAPEWVETERDLDFLDRLMHWLEDLRARLEGRGLNLNRYGQSLFEIARYELMGRLAPWFRRWELVGELSADRDDLLMFADAWPSPWRLKTEAALSERAKNSFKVVRSPLQHQRMRSELTEVAFTRWQREKRRWSFLAKRSSSFPRRQAVFTEFFTNSAKGQLVVAHELETQHGLPVTWLAARPEVRAALEPKGIESLLLEDFGSLRSAVDGWLTGSERRAVRSAVEHLDGGRKTKSVLTSALVSSLSHAAQWLTAYRGALEQLEPQVLVSTTYSSVVGRAAACAARSLGVQSVYVQHGAFPDRYVYAFFCHDALCMWGRYEAEGLKRHGVRPDSLYATGATLYDGLIRRAREKKAQAPVQPDHASVHPDRPSAHTELSRGGGATARGKRRVLFLASRTGGAFSTVEVSRRTLKAIGQLSLELPDIELTVKTHPADSTQVPDEVLREFPQVRLKRSGSSQDLVLESDAAIVVSSTTGFEACVVGIPLVVFNLTQEPSPLEFSRYGAALEVTVEGQLKATLERALDDTATRDALAQGRRKLLDFMLDSAQGNAAQRVAQVVIERRNQCLRAL